MAFTVKLSSDSDNKYVIPPIRGQDHASISTIFDKNNNRWFLRVNSCGTQNDCDEDSKFVLTKDDESKVFIINQGHYVPLEVHMEAENNEIILKSDMKNIENINNDNDNIIERYKKLNKIKEDENKRNDILKSPIDKYIENNFAIKNITNKMKCLKDEINELQRLSHKLSVENEHICDKNIDIKHTWLDIVNKTHKQHHIETFQTEGDFWN